MVTEPEQEGTKDETTGTFGTNDNPKEADAMVKNAATIVIDVPDPSSSSPPSSSPSSDSRALIRPIPVKRTPSALMPSESEDHSIDDESEVVGGAAPNEEVSENKGRPDVAETDNDSRGINRHGYTIPHAVVAAVMETATPPSSSSSSSFSSPSRAVAEEKKPTVNANEDTKQVTNGTHPPPTTTTTSTHAVFVPPASSFPRFSNELSSVDDLSERQKSRRRLIPIPGTGADKPTSASELITGDCSDLSLFADGVDGDDDANSDDDNHHDDDNFLTKEDVSMPHHSHDSSRTSSSSRMATTTTLKGGTGIFRETKPRNPLARLATVPSCTPHVGVNPPAFAVDRGDGKGFVTRKVWGIPMV